MASEDKDAQVQEPEIDTKVEDQLVAHEITQMAPKDKMISPGPEELVKDELVSSGLKELVKDFKSGIKTGQGNDEINTDLDEIFRWNKFIALIEAKLSSHSKVLDQKDRELEALGKAVKKSHETIKELEETVKDLRRIIRNNVHCECHMIGKCKKNPKCNYFHKASTRQLPCKYQAKHGECKMRARCRYSHDSPNKDRPVTKAEKKETHPIKQTRKDQADTDQAEQPQEGQSDVATLQPRKEGTMNSPTKQPKKEQVKAGPIRRSNKGQDDGARCPKEDDPQQKNRDVQEGAYGQDNEDP